MWKPEHRRAADRHGLCYPSDLSDSEWAPSEPSRTPATASPAAASRARSTAAPARNKAPQNRPTAPPEPNPSAPVWRAADDPITPASQDRHRRTAPPTAGPTPASLPSTRASPTALAPSRSAPTRATMPPISLRNCARSMYAHMSPVIPAAGARRSTGARRAIPATPPASASASGSRRRSAGSRWLRACARPSCAGCPRSTGASPSRSPPTIWCGRRS